MRAAQHAHYGNLLFQVRVAEHAAEGAVRERVDGTRLLGVDHVDDVGQCIWRAPPTIHSDLPLLGRNFCVEHYRIGERMFGDVDRPIVLPPPNDSGVADHQHDGGQRQTIAVDPARSFGPACNRATRDPITR